MHASVGAGARESRVREVAEERRPGTTDGAVAATAPPRARLPARFAVFVAERFPPLSYGPLIGAFVASGTVAAAAASGARPPIGGWTVAITLLVATAFLQLRILDEIRDADVDRVGRPERPVPRGLVTVSELRALAVAVGVAGAGLSVLLGPPVVLTYAVATGTIWLLGTGPLQHEANRYPRLRGAISHSVIAPELLLCAWAVVAPIRPIPELGASLLLGWGASLAMEVSRKTVLPIEEREGVQTYSKELGRRGALVVAALAIAFAFIGAAGLAFLVKTAALIALVPIVAAAAVPVVAARFGDRLSSAAVQSAAAALVLIVLLWPVIIMLGLE